MGTSCEAGWSVFLGCSTVIFITVGTQLSFNRLIKAVDVWAADHSSIEFFAQIGPGAEPPRSMQYAEFLSPSDVDSTMRQAELIVAHAGMGSILTALRYQRPILILPRRAELGEHRNDHQLATARWLDGRPGVTVAWEEAEVHTKLNGRHALAVGTQLPEFASGPLVERLAAYIGSAKK